MAIYTMTLQEMLKIEPLFDFTYSMDETYITKSTLEALVINHYLLYEIGFETITRFKQFFASTYIENLIEFNERVKLYNELINTTSGNNKRIYHENKQENNTVSTLQPAMSNAPINNRYANKRVIENPSYTLDGWETIPATEYFNKIKNDIKPYVIDFIETLSECFMGVY